MARLWTAGFESQHYFSEGLTSASSASPYLTYDTSTVRVTPGGTSASVKFDSTSTPAAAFAHFAFTATNGYYYYFRGYFKRSSTTAQTGIPIFSYRNNTGVSQLEVRFDASNRLQLYNANSAANIGSPSAAIDTDWHRLEVGIMVVGSGTLNCYAELLLDGTSIASSTAQTFSTTALGGLRFGWYSTPGASQQIWFDDCALNNNQGSSQTGWAGIGYVWLLKPVSDTTLNAWTGGAGGTSNVFEGMNNTPPVGVAIASATDASQACNNSASGNTGTWTTETYDNQIPSTHGITLLLASLCSSASYATVNGSLQVSSNPTDGGAQALNFYSGSTAGGAFPTNWKYVNTQGTGGSSPTDRICYLPSVTRSSGIQVQMAKTTNNSSRNPHVCYLGVIVESVLTAVTYTRDTTGISAAIQSLGLERPITGISAAIQSLGLERPITGVSASVEAASTTYTHDITGVSAAVIPVHEDTFNRADQSGIGTASDGCTYTNAGGQTTVSITSQTYQIVNVNSIVSHVHGSVTYSDVEAGLDFKYTGAVLSVMIQTRQQSISAASNAYRFRYTSGAISVGTVTANTFAQIGTVYNYTVSADTWYRIRIKNDGYALRMKIWARDTASEPASWQIDVVDTGSTYASGYVCFGGNPGGTTGRQYNLDNFWMYAPFTGLGIERAITGVSVALQAVGVGRASTGISSAVQALGIERPITGVSTSVTLPTVTYERAITGVSVGVQAPGLERSITGVTTAIQAVGLARSITGITAAMQAVGIARNVTGVSAGVQALGLTCTITNVSSAVQAPGLTRPITGVTTAAQALGLERPITGISSSVMATAMRNITGVSVAVSHIWYVSGAVSSSGDGKSWASAWKTLADIAWGSIAPNDVIEIDGGSSGMVYTDRLMIGASGTAGNPITLKASTTSGHDGPILQDGGRTTPLPYASQSSGSWTETAVRYQGIYFGSNSYITIDGSRWHGWRIYGGRQDGIEVGGSHNTFRYLEIYDNGTATSGADGWSTDRPGLHLSGDYHTVEYCDLHDNGQDCFQTGDAANHLIVRKTWMHNTREHPNYPGYAWNQNHPPLYDSGAGTHTDGYQIYGASPITDLIFQDCLFGPGLMQGTILQATTSAIAIQQCLFLWNTNGTAIMGYPAIADTTWSIEQVTIHSHGILYIEGTGHSVTNTIVQGGSVSLDNTLSVSSGVIQYDCTAYAFPNSLTYLGGTTVDPDFVTDVSTFSNPPTFDELYAADFTPQATAATGKGCTHFVSRDTFLAYVGAPLPRSRSLTGISAATQALGITRSITGVTTAIQALGLACPITGVTAAVQAVGIARPVISISTSLLFTGLRSLTGISSAMKALGITLPIIGVTGAIGQPGIEHSITGISTALQAFGVARSITGISAATQQLDITRPITGISASASVNHTRSISGISAATQQTDIARPLSGITTILAVTNTRSLSSISTALQAFGVTRPITGISTSASVNHTRSITGISSTVLQPGIARTISGISVATQQTNIERPLTGITISIAVTHLRTVTGISTALQAFGVTRSITGISSAMKALGITRSITGITGAIGQPGIERSITGISTALKALDVARTITGISSAVQALGVTRPLIGISVAVRQNGIERAITGISSSLRQTLTHPITDISSSVQATLTRPISGISSVVALRNERAVTDISGAMQAPGVTRSISGILVAIGVAGLTRTITGVHAAICLPVLLPYRHMIVTSPRGSSEVVSPRGTIEMQEE